MFVQFTPRERMGYAAIAALLLFGFGYVGAKHLRKPAPIVFENIGDAGTQAQSFNSTPAAKQAESAAPSENLYIHIVGAVAKPGLFRLPPGSRVNDALAAAGGAKPTAALDQINLAERLVDGSQIRIPSKTDLASAAEERSTTSSPVVSGSMAPLGVEPNSYLMPPETTKRSALSPNGKEATAVNVNTASVTELEALPGIGPAIAQRIADYRQLNGGFKSVDELLAVNGIGPKKLEAMRALVRL